MPATPNLKSLGRSFSDEVAKFIGDPYVYGAAGATSFDCSGLVQYALEQLGVKNVPRTSEAQAAWATPVKASDLQPGDLVFSQWPGDGASPGHVAVYVGGGEMVEAPRPGENVHKIALNDYYKRYVTGYGRVPGVAFTGDTPGSSSSNGSAEQAGFGSVISGALGSIPIIGPFLTAGTALSDVANAIMSTVGPIAQVFADLGKALETTMTIVLWLINPMNWVRIVAGVVGAAALVTGVALVATAA